MGHAGSSYKEKIVVFFSDLNMIKSVLLSYVCKYIVLISISTLSLAL